MNSERYAVLDGIRGIAVINMVIYHGIWDLVYLFGYDWLWFQSLGVFFWQQYICCTFIFLSGFCQPFGKKKLKKGRTVFVLGFLISILICIIMPEERIYFGILTLIGSCILIAIPMESFLEKFSPIMGLIISVFAFVFTRNVNQGYLGFGTWNIVSLPDNWYCNTFTAYLGFPMAGFHSADYFPLIPWLFLFIAGYFTQRLFTQKELLLYLKPQRAGAIEWIGRHSLAIYLIHQPALYFLLDIILTV